MIGFSSINQQSAMKSQSNWRMKWNEMNQLVGGSAADWLSCGLSLVSLLAARSLPPLNSKNSNYGIIWLWAQHARQHKDNLINQWKRRTQLISTFLSNWLVQLLCLQPWARKWNQGWWNERINGINCGMKFSREERPPAYNPAQEKQWEQLSFSFD